MSRALHKVGIAVLSARDCEHLTAADTESNLFSQNPPAAHQAVQRARKAMLENQHAQALSLVFDAIKSYPGWAPLYTELANVLRHSGHTAAATAAHNGKVDRDLWASHHDWSAAETAGECGITWQRMAIDDAEHDEITLAPPSNIDIDFHKVFTLGLIKLNPTFVDLIDKGYLWHEAHNTFVFDSHEHCIEEHGIGNQHVVDTLRARYRPHNIAGRAILLGTRGISNYFHWMLDILPKLELCRRAGITFSSDDRFVVPFLQRDFQLETLAQWGIKQQQIYATHEVSPYLQAEQFVIPYLHNHLATRLARWVPGYLRGSFLPSDADLLPPQSRLFVSRNASGTQGRQVSNQAALDRFLEQYGFQVIYPEQYSVQEQALLFAQAAVVVAPHGAGLTNIVFCPPATIVIELFAAHIAPCYWVLSTLMALQYRALACPLEADQGVVQMDQPRSRQQRKQLGFSVELAQLSALFDELGIDQAAQ